MLCQILSFISPLMSTHTAAVLSIMLGDIIDASDNSLVRDSILEPGCSAHANVEVSSLHVMLYTLIVHSIVSNESRDVELQELQF
jgi:hypothetical protein